MKPVEDFGVHDVEMHLKHMNLKFRVDGRNFDQGLMNPSHPIYMFTKEMTRNKKYIQSYCDLLSVLPKRLDVLEFCAGIGVLAEAVYPLILYEKWVGVELDPSCVANWMSIHATVEKGDMYDATRLVEWFGYNKCGNTLVVADWPTNTLRKFWAEPIVRVWMTQLVSYQPRYIALTDIETGWIHMPNHYPHYAPLFDKIGTMERITERKWGTRAQVLRDDYVHIYANYMLETFGYRVINHTNGGGGDYFLMEIA